MASRRPSAEKVHSLPTCTDSALQIKKGIYIVPSRIHISRFLPFDTAWRRLSYNPIRLFTPRYLALRPQSACTKTTERVLSCLKSSPCVRKLFFFSFLFLVFIIDLRKKERRFWCVGFFSNYYPLYRGNRSRYCRVGGDKKRKGTFSISLAFFLSIGCTFIPMLGSF
jgi:hypothetical protein